MGWADSYIEQLKQGKTIQFRPRGSSMEPKIKSGELVTLAPASIDTVKDYDIVLCKVHGRQYLHLIRSIGSDGACLIANNKGHINGWTREIYGVLVR